MRKWFLRANSRALSWSAWGLVGPLSQGGFLARGCGKYSASRCELPSRQSLLPKVSDRFWGRLRNHILPSALWLGGWLFLAPAPNGFTKEETCRLLGLRCPLLRKKCGWLCPQFQISSPVLFRRQRRFSCLKGLWNSSVCWLSPRFVSIRPLSVRCRYKFRWAGPCTVGPWPCPLVWHKPSLKICQWKVKLTEVSINFVSVHVAPFVERVGLLEEVGCLLPVARFNGVLTFFKEGVHEFLLALHLVEELGCPHKVLDLFFGWIASVLLRDVGFVKQEDARRETYFVRWLYFVVNVFCVDKAESEVTVGFE